MKLGDEVTEARLLNRHFVILNIRNLARKSDSLNRVSICLDNGLSGAHRQAII